LPTILLAIILAILSALPFKPPSSPSPQPSDSNQVAVAWAHRYRIDVTLAQSILSAAERHGLDARVAFRLVQRESRFRANALGDAGEIGLTQIKPSTARSLRPGITIAELYRPDVNLELGFAYLAHLRAHYHGDLWRAATAYNHGMSAADTLPRHSEYAIELMGMPDAAARAREPAPAPSSAADLSTARE
jgi:soluble lytic murein transglycosylase-like protein